MSQGGLKHAATESRLDSKRERRRGAAGRASVLRRAPSDSDCSGETASLSADSGDRAIRPIPQPARSGKSRSRRRGSEWEVLEGLKDGQRFEKRPDVFNGYLHKKRKWPLKGWHKRYFVVDGGILVYARSPTDVARGRLHGSVDVGLSVISAKARRRRIDIDADEFIYHLRAKTPDLFRTWLNVLKTHRLYRQHLLTFGARESVPKIHAPMEDMPPTDTSSRSSCMSMVTAESTSAEELINSKASEIGQKPLSDKSSSITKSSLVTQKTPPTIADDGKQSLAAINRSVVNVESNVDKSEDVKVKYAPITEKSNKDNHKTTESKSCYVTTQIRKRSKTNTDILRQVENNITETKSTLFRSNKAEATTAYYFFARKKSLRESEHMKRSRKSTNLVKYKNILDEPKLKRPLSKCMLLGKFPTIKLSEPDDFEKHTTVTLQKHTTVTLPKEPESLHIIMNSKEYVNSSIQDTMSASEYSEITENILLSVFRNRNPYSYCETDVKAYINKIVEELYEVKLHHCDANPVKTLFRCLLEFWLKHNKNELFQNVTLSTKSVGPRSNYCFTVDKEVSSFRLSLQSKGTQYNFLSSLGRQPQPYKRTNDTTKLVGKPPKFKKEKVKPPLHSPRRDTESFEKERRVQELERILNNTIYVCDVQSLENKEKDVRITKALLDNLGRRSKNADANKSSDINDSSSSAEVPKIQETINHLISDTSMPADVAKEFLNAYLGVLNNDTSKSATENSTSPSGDTMGKPVEIDCNVQSEAVQRKMSKSVTTEHKSDKFDHVKDKDRHKVEDPGQQYLKDILDKVTTIFSRINFDHGQKTADVKSKVESQAKDELGRSVKKYPGKNLIREDYDTNSVVIDLSKYDLEHISMFSDPNMKDIMSITIKLKEKPQNSGETQKAHLSLKFSDDGLRTTRPESKNWFKAASISSSNILDKQNPKRSLLDFRTVQHINELKSFVSSCEISSKAYCRIVHESEHSLDLSFKSSKFYQHSKKNEKKEDPQSCYIMSFQKKNLAAKPLKIKKKVRLKECHGLILNSRTNSSTKQKCGCTDEYTIFEKPAPKLIDEKFILTLLENLTFLSKDLPAVHKDINSLYVKLKKKHEKVVKSNNIQGLSLLGKIYNEEYLKSNDIETQASASKSTTQMVSNTKKEAVGINTTNLLNTDVIPTNTSNVLKYNDVSTNTSDVINTNDMPATTSKALNNNGTNTSEVKKCVKDTSTSVTENYCRKNCTKEKEMLTEGVVVEIEPHRHGFLNRKRIFDVYHSSSQTICDDTSTSKEITADQAVSEQNWHKTVHTEDCAVSTIIKCVLNKQSPVENPASEFGNMMASLEISVPKKGKNNKRSKHKQHNLTNEIKLRSPSFKVSTPSQTERNFQNRSTDFHVYQLHSYYAQKEVDCMSDSSEIRHWRSEIKLLYKCRSEPSLASESGGPLENVSRELGQAQLSVQQLQRLLDALELQQQVHHDTDVCVYSKVEVDVL